MLRATFLLVKSYGQLINAPIVAVPLRKNGLLSTSNANNTSTVSTTLRMYANAATGYVVKHDPESNSFYIDVNGKGRAFLEYEQDDGTITLLHTEIPEKLQGLGLGKIIAKEALEYVAKNQLEMKIECEFVQHFVQKYEPKYLQYISKDN